jgi:hypothetical protein
MRQARFKLTFSGSFCVNPDCLRPLYVEQMMDEFDEVCYECWSDRQFPPLVLLQGGKAPKRKASSKNHVTAEEVASFCDEMEAKRARVKAAKILHGVFHCEKSCCAGDEAG